MGMLGLPEITFLVVVTLVVIYLLSLQRFLEKCAPESRAVSPRAVWLMLIPLFNGFWHFLLVIKISKTLHNELTRRNLPDAESESLKRLGLVMCSAAVVAGIVLGQTSFNSFGAMEAASAICFSAYLVCLVMYWRKIAAYSRALRADTDFAVTIKPIPAKGVWWWAGFVVLESYVVLSFAAKDTPQFASALSIPIPLIALAVCFWWYSQSKLLPRRAFVLRFLGYVLFGLGTLGATLGSMGWIASGAEHAGRGALLVCGCLAMIAGSYFTVFDRRGARRNSQRESARASNAG
jgi:hypothetical protein